MAGQAFDPARFKQQQRRDWDAAATGWKRWWQTLERGAQHVSDRMVELAELQPGQSVVDIATGIGEPAVTAARRVGPAGRVVAIDQAPAMLAIARERAQALKITNIDFREADAESLALEERDFDAVLCRWGLMFMPDLHAALGGMYRLLKPGGRLAVSVWSSPDKVPMISLAGDTVRRLAGIPVPPPGAFDPFRLANTAILEDALGRAGFTGVRIERLANTFEFASAEAFTEFRRDVSAPFRTMLATKPPELQKEILDAVTASARAYAGSDGLVRVTNETICVSARR